MSYYDEVLAYKGSCVYARLLDTKQKLPAPKSQNLF